MATTIKKQGTYELFRTTGGNRIIELGGDYFAIVEGQKGEMLVGSDADHEKDEVLQRGSFKLVEFEDDAKFQDIPHLFLEHDGRYDEAIVPRGLPSKKGDRERFIYTDHKLDIAEVDSYLESPRSGEGSEGRGRPGGGSAANVTHHLRGTDFPQRREDLLERARSSGAPPEVLEQLGKLPAKRFGSMADVVAGLGEAVQAGRPPIDDYDRKDAREILAVMADLGREGIEKVRDYERENYGRKTILRRADELLETEQPPVEGYVDLSAAEVEDRIREMRPPELERLRAYEKGHRNRQTVLEAIDRRLRRSGGAG